MQVQGLYKNTLGLGQGLAALLQDPLSNLYPPSERFPCIPCIPCASCTRRPVRLTPMRQCAMHPACSCTAWPYLPCNPCAFISHAFHAPHASMWHLHSALAPMHPMHNPLHYLLRLPWQPKLHPPALPRWVQDSLICAHQRGQ